MLQVHPERTGLGQHMRRSVRKLGLQAARRSSCDGSSVEGVRRCRQVAMSAAYGGGCVGSERPPAGVQAAHAVISAWSPRDACLMKGIKQKEGGCMQMSLWPAKEMSATSGHG